MSIDVDAWLAEHAENEAKERERQAKIDARLEAKKQPRPKPVPKRKREDALSQQPSAAPVIGEDGQVIVQSAPELPVKKKKVEPVKKTFPCALCPDLSEDTLVEIEEVNPGKTPKMAHRVSSPRLTGERGS